MKQPVLSQSGFRCRIDGLGLIRPAVSQGEVCARLKATLSARIKGPDAPARARLDGLSVALTLRPPGIATARLRGGRGGGARDYAEVSVAVSDQPLSLAVIDDIAEGLADEVNRTAD